MLDGRLAQLVIDAKMLDERPDVVLEMLTGMVIVRAGPITFQGSHGIRYVVWHPKLPHMPLHSIEPGVEPPYPFLDNDFKQRHDGAVRYEWLHKGKLMIAGEWIPVKATIQ